MKFLNIKSKALLFMFPIAIQMLLTLAGAQSQDRYFAPSYISDVDFSDDKGFHSNFSALQSGPDSIHDILREENTNTTGSPNYELDMEIQWTNVDFEEEEEVLAIFVDEGNNTHSFDATGGYIAIEGGDADWGSITGTISFWIQWDVVSNRPWGQNTDMEIRFLGAKLILDWGGSSSLISNTSFVAGRWYFIAITWNENSNELSLYVGDQEIPPNLDVINNMWISTVSTLLVTENNFMASRGGVEPTDGHGDDLRYWNIDRSFAEIVGDYDKELNGSEPNLQSYFRFNNNLDNSGSGNDSSAIGSYSFSSSVPFDSTLSEGIQVYVWSESSWQPILTNLVEGWNNASVYPFLNSTMFTIRLKGVTEMNDVEQNYWSIDAALLYVWSGGDPISPWPIEWTLGILAILACGILLPLAMRFRSQTKRNEPESLIPASSEQGSATYHQLTGKKMLLEIDPTVDYHNTLVNFVSQAVDMEQQPVVFTSRNSALHANLFDKRVEFFLLTPKTSSSKKISSNETLIPINDLSILLDTFIKVSKTDKEKSVTILFDNLSDTILMCGFEKTYKFLRFLLETLPSPEVTALFIFNPTAHDTAISSSIRGLFHFRLTDWKADGK